MKRIGLFSILASLLFISISCSDPNTENPNKEIVKEVLPSWNEGETKTAIINFVEGVTDPSSPFFVKVEDRIAVFDNDGNLWAEKPLYFQLYFAADQITKQAPQHPEWDDLPPFAAIMQEDFEELLKTGKKGLLDVVLESHSGTTPEAFRAEVKSWLDRARHPELDRPFTDLVYQPMLELLDYLRENEFTTFIVSGGGVEFMRVWANDVYGIPTHQVVGSSLKIAYVDSAEPYVLRMPELEFIDDKEGKPLGIQKYIGKRPIFCSGNSDGDLAMMEWTAAGKGPKFNLYLHHTDSIREWAYDRESLVGRLDKGLDAAISNGWIITDMKKDWKVVFPN